MDIFDEIKKVDELTIYDVWQSVLDRYKELFPDWEIRTVAIRVDMEREAQYEDVLRLLKSAQENMIEAEKMPTYKDRKRKTRYTPLKIVKR